MISVLGVLSFAGCAKKQDEKKTETSSEASTQEASAQVFAMDTYMNLKAYGKNAQKAVDDAKSEIERLDQLWSAVDKNSEIYQLNQKKKMKVSDETLELIEFAKKKSKESNDAFDISIYPIVELWGFPTQKYRVPSDREIQKLLKNVNHVSRNRQTSFFAFLQTFLRDDLRIDKIVKLPGLRLCHEHPSHDADLRCCQSHALCLTHGLYHIIQDHLRPFRHLIHFPARLAQDRITILQNISKCHLFLLSAKQPPAAFC